MNFSNNYAGEEKFIEYHSHRLALYKDKAQYMENRSPTYRSTVNLNHEETMKQLREYGAPQHRRQLQSMYKPEDKMGIILSHVMTSENRENSRSGTRSKSFSRIFG